MPFGCIILRHGTFEESSCRNASRFGVHSMGVSIPKWLVYFMENPKLGWFREYPYFRKPPNEQKAKWLRAQSQRSDVLTDWNSKFQDGKTAKGCNILNRDLLSRGKSRQNRKDFCDQTCSSKLKVDLNLQMYVVSCCSKNGASTISNAYAILPHAWSVVSNSWA